MIVYKTTNLINGKIYVGQHNTSADDGYLGSGFILKKAINKYGKDNFKREILEHCTEENVCERESFWIKELDARGKNGYNILSGGPLNFAENNPNYGNWWSEEKKKELGNKRKELGLAKGENNPMYGKGNTILGENNSFYGKNHTEETKRKISEKNKEYWAKNKPPMKGRGGLNHPCGRYLYSLISPNGVEYSNIQNLGEFCKKYNLKYDGIISAFSAKRSSYKGWKIFREEYNG